MSSSQRTILEVSNLTTCFDTRLGRHIAVDNISYTLTQGEVLGIIGESGSGKSVSCYSMLGLIPSPPGKVLAGSAIFNGDDLLTVDLESIRKIRGNHIAMIFQDPMTSLNPTLTVGEQLIEPLLYHANHSRVKAKKKAIELLREVEIPNPEQAFHAWPHEFSGGMRQRIVIAMALINDPILLLADEPTTALDATVQKTILDLLKRIQSKRQFSVIFISHDLRVVQGFADNILVMKSGKVVERGSASQVINHPQHSYTQSLIDAIPKDRTDGTKKRLDILTEKPTILEVKNLFTYYQNRQSKQRFAAVNDVSLSLKQGEILGLVGGSGSGKSTLGRSIMRLVEPSKGKIIFNGVDLLKQNKKTLLEHRKDIQMVFQDPYSSLNPRMTVFQTLEEPLVLNADVQKNQIKDRVMQLLNDVGLDAQAMNKYPHEFSGGQRQRVAIARALASDPKVIIADEPVSALDVTIQAQIIALLKKLNQKREISMIFITHDLAVMRALCDNVMVMHTGKTIETGNVEEIWNAPKNDYTHELIEASQFKN